MPSHKHLPPYMSEHIRKLPIYLVGQDNRSEGLSCENIFFHPPRKNGDNSRMLPTHLPAKPTRAAIPGLPLPHRQSVCRSRYATGVAYYFPLSRGFHHRSRSCNFVLLSDQKTRLQDPRPILWQWNWHPSVPPPPVSLTALLLIALYPFPRIATANRLSRPKAISRF